MNTLRAFKVVLLLATVSYGFSCEKSEEEEVILDPVISSQTNQSNANATYTTVQVKGDVKDNTNELKARGVVWNTKGNPTIMDAGKVETSNTFTTTIDQLNPNTTYFFRVYATTATNTFYSEQFEVKTKGLAGTTWDFRFLHDNTPWNGDVTFYADGTTLYDEPAYPGKYLARGTWKMEGNKLTYDMIGDDTNPLFYMLTGTIEGNSMKGTYTFGQVNKNWTAVPR